MKTVLITGICGFVGRHVAVKFKQEGYRVIGIGRGTWSLDQQLKYGVDRFIEGEVTQEHLQDIAEDLSCIVHCAGSSTVSRSFEDPVKDFKDSVGSVVETLDFVRQKHPKTKFVYISGATVYGLQEDVCLHEDMVLYPVSPYGAHKKIIEELCKMYNEVFGLPISIMRSFSLYGPDLKKQLLWDACEKLTNNDTEDAVFWGTGQETRDWFHINDATDLIFIASQSASPWCLINGGSGDRVTIRETLDFLKKNLASSKNIVFTGQGRTGDPKYFWADIAKAKALGWQPKIGWQQGLAEYAQWYKQQKASV